MGIGASIGASVGSSLIGGIAQSGAAGQAASAQRQAAAQANATEQHFFDVSNQNLQPFIQTGSAAANKLSNLEGLNGNSPSNIQATLESLPGYQFANTQGLKSTQNAATARGLGVSGAALKGAAGFSTGLANSYYNNLLTGIQGTENTGENAAASLTGAATTTGGNIASNQIGAGNATANSALATGAGIANAAAGVPNGLITGQLLQNIQNQGNNNNNSSIYSAANQAWSQQNYNQMNAADNNFSLASNP